MDREHGKGDTTSARKLPSLWLREKGKASRLGLILLSRELRLQILKLRMVNLKLRGFAYPVAESLHGSLIPHDQSIYKKLSVITTTIVLPTAWVCL